MVTTSRMTDRMTKEKRPEDRKMRKNMNEFFKKGVTA